MKNVAIIGVVSFIVFIVSCSSHNPISPFPAPTPFTVGNLSFSPLNGTLLKTSSNIVTSQAEYLSDYSYTVSSGPTPTPVPIDFNKKMVIGFPVFIDCCGSSTWTLTTITTDCKTTTVDILKTFNSCGPICACGFVDSITYWYVMDKTSLPLEVQTTLIDECEGTTTTSTTSTAPFNVTITSVGTFIKITTTANPI